MTLVLLAAALFTPNAPFAFLSEDLCAPSRPIGANTPWNAMEIEKERKELQSTSAIVRFDGSAFEGGAKAKYGGSYDGASVNYVYAVPSGELSKMNADFSLGFAPSDPLSLHLRARDDDGAGASGIRISVNGQAIFEGRNPFPERGWTSRAFPIPGIVLNAGVNRLLIENIEPQGVAGMPPWFMVAEAAIAPPSYTWRPQLEKDFFVELPKEQRPFPEPLKPGERPGFKLRGLKGWTWRPEKYLEVIPKLSRLKLNFLMNCYGSMCDVENLGWGHPQCNRWYEPLPEAKKKAYGKVVRECQKAGITFCFSMNPNLLSPKPLRYDSEADFELLWRHYAWMQGLGVKWFNISLDDISQGIDASGQAKLVNKVLGRLRAKDPGAQMIFCPTYYWGDGTDKDAKPYLDKLALELSPEVYLFWTGDKVVGPVTRKAAETYRGIVKHRLFLWDNYPVNDDNPTMHLGPVVHRDPGLGEVIDGYMSNSMCRQTEGNMVSLATCADYAYNPRAYDPARSIGQAILLYASSKAQREALKDLVELYPGCLIYGDVYCNFNPVRDAFGKLAKTPHPKTALEAYLAHLAAVLARFEKAFPASFKAEQKTLKDDLAWCRKVLSGKYGD